MRPNTALLNFYLAYEETRLTFPEVEIIQIFEGDLWIWQLTCPDALITRNVERFLIRAATRLHVQGNTALRSTRACPRY